MHAIYNHDILILFNNIKISSLIAFQNETSNMIISLYKEQQYYDYKHFYCEISGRSTNTYF